MVLVCTYSGWPERFPTKTEKASEVCRVLLREIIPRYGLLLTIDSDNRPSFVAEMTQELAIKLKIKWSLRAAYRFQSSRMIEEMN